MKEFPHKYNVKVLGRSEGNLTTSAENVPTIEVASPIQFDGPGNQWSPEELLMASITNCLVLSFRAIAKASKFEWHSIECESCGELDKVGRKVQFTSVLTKVRLLISSNDNKDKAEQLLNKAEQTCFISNSLSCESGIECEIIFSSE